MLLKLPVIALVLSPALLFAQDAKPEEVAAPVAAKGDVEFLDAIMADGERWYALSILWVAESETQKLPAQYLPENK